MCMLYFVAIATLCFLQIQAIENNFKFDCYPERYVNETLCLKRGCQWQQMEHNPLNIPECFYGDRNNFTFGVVKNSSLLLGEKISLSSNANDISIFPDKNLFQKPVVNFELQTETRLRIKIEDAKIKRYEVPVQNDFVKIKKKPLKHIYYYSYESNPFSFKVFAVREKQSVKIWDTSVGAMILSNQFLQLSTVLPSSYLYGIGENSHTTFKRDLSKWHSIGLFSKDAAPYPFHNTNLYGVHPFYMIMEPDGNAHGVLLLNSNAMDITLQPTPALTYRTIGGILDFYFFFGPTPEEVVQQYTQLIGRPVMPSYWSLGFQLCRYGYNSLDEVKRTVARMSKYDIPQDVQYGDIDYMNRQLDFTYDNTTYHGLPEFVRKIKNQGIKYITILDPAISAEEEPGSYETYDLGNNLDIWIKDETGKVPLYGKVWPDKPNVTVNTSWPWDMQTKYFRANVTFPDWFHPNIESWWNELIKKFHKTIEFDGLWIDMNEAANFVKGSVKGCPKNNLENPPYKPKVSGDLSEKTLCMSALHHDNQKEYNYHSLFGWKQTVITRRALTQTTGKRGIVISRSTFTSSGKYAGHWLGDNKSAWPQMHESIIGMFDFSLFGIPYSGADICGFNEDTTRELCNRWMQLGAFYPMSRNHNGLGFKPQDPAVFGDQFAENSRDILHVRYTLLPYLYTLFYEAHTYGNTVVRPLFHVYPKDKATLDVDKQFFWGDALLITPVLEKSVTTVRAYLPRDRWFDWFTGMETSAGLVGQFTTWSIALDKIGLHIRGGRILPTQEPANNTLFSRKNPMGLIVALDDRNEASGTLYWDDGDSIDAISSKKFLMLHFNATTNGLIVDVQMNGYRNVDNLIFEEITILGISRMILSDVTIDGQTNFTVSSTNGKVLLKNLKLPITSPHNITWRIEEMKSASVKNSCSFVLVVHLMVIFIVNRWI